MDLALNNPQKLIWHKTQTNKQKKKKQQHLITILFILTKNFPKSIYLSQGWLQVMLCKGS